MAGDGAQEDGLPVVLLVGDLAIGQKLLQALGEAEADTALGVIKTKYYSARVQYRLVPAVEATTTAIEKAEAVVLLWDLHLEQLQALKALFPKPDDDVFDDGPDRVQLCLAVGSAGEGDVDGAREWCIDQGFEFLSCTLSDDDLQTLTRRAAGHTERSRAGLLDDDSENSVLRLIEALECHSSWSNMEPIKASTVKEEAAAVAPAEEAAKENGGYTALPDAPEAPKGAQQAKETGMEKVHDRIQDDDFAEADEFEKFAREMKEIRAMSDQQRRRDKACDLALRLAASLGVDESDSD